MAKSSDGKLLTIAVVNPTTSSYELELNLSNASQKGGGRHFYMTSSDPLAYNEPGKPSNVFIEEKNITGVEKLNVLSLSINIYELEAS